MLGSADAPTPHPGGSSLPASSDADVELRRYERHRGDHVARYRTIADRGTLGRVLDLGCGHGFGALLLRGRYATYLGVDVDAPAVDWARRVVAPAAPGSSFAGGAIPEGAGPFDTIFCFEVLEHVTDPVALLSSLRTAAAPGATVYLSTPNGSLSEGRPEWFMSPYHVAEYTAAEFQRIVGTVFGGPGTYFAQRRVDGLDWLLPALRSRLAGARGAGPSARGTPNAPVADGLRRAHALFRRIPSPLGLWRMTPVRAPPSDRLDCSHWVWVGPAAGPTRP